MATLKTRPSVPLIDLPAHRTTGQPAAFAPRQISTSAKAMADQQRCQQQSQQQ